MERTNPSVTIGKAVDHDVETGVDAALRGAGVVLIRWIGNVQREMVMCAKENSGHKENCEEREGNLQAECDMR